MQLSSWAIELNRDFSLLADLLIVNFIMLY